MALIRNEIPILEYDSDPSAIIMPEHEQLDLKLPEKCVFAFLGGAVDRYAKAHGAIVAAEFESITKNYPVYILDYQGIRVCLMQAPMGAPAATQILDWLICYGVRQVISGGSCGTLTEIPENTFLVPAEAMRDEGTSYHYLPPARFIDINPDARRAIEQVLSEHGHPYREVVTWTTDGFYRETKEKTAYRINEGCEVVEMECSALAACASKRGILWGELLYTADSLANAEQYQERGWGRDSLEYALELCLEAVVKI